MAPLRVAGLMEFHVFETEPLILRTYCIAPGQVEGFTQRVDITLQIKKKNKKGVDKEEISRGKMGADSGKRRRLHKAHVTMMSDKELQLPHTTDQKQQMNGRKCRVSERSTHTE